MYSNLLNSGLRALLYFACAMLVLDSDFACFWVLFGFFPLLHSPGLLLASRTAALQTAAWSSISPLWEDKYFGRLEGCKLRRKPAGRLLGSRSVKREAGLDYVHALGP